jgi:hypothetical protein
MMNVLGTRVDTPKEMSAPERDTEPDCAAKIRVCPRVEMVPPTSKTPGSADRMRAERYVSVTVCPESV